MYCWSCSRTVADDARTCHHCGDTFPYDRVGLGGGAGGAKLQSWLGVRLADRYRLDAYVARGGMGIVFRGWDERLQRTVAVKLIADELASDDDTKRRFLREARALSSLEHEQVVRAHDCGLHEGRPYLVMQFLEGETLATRLAQGGPLSPTEARRLSLQVCDGLEHIHAHGFTHRDVKPQNLFLAAGRSLGDTGPRCVVLDFGVLRQHGSVLTGSAEFLGTPAYAAPEQWSAPRSASRRSDVYALGVVLFEMVTGALPFHGGSFVEVRHAHATRPIPSALGLAPQLPPAVDELFATALAKDPAHRFPTALAMAAAIRALL